MKFFQLVLVSLSFLCYVYSKEFKTANYSRMVGGQAVDISDLPYAASILHLGEHICGGVIVSRYFVLTAASCFKNVQSEEQIQVRVGSFRAYYSGIIIDADFYILYPDYGTDFASTEHDVALVRLAYPLKFDNNIQPAAVADLGEEPVAGSLAVVIGWERFEVTRDIAGDLRQINVTIVDGFDCFVAYMDIQDITKNHLCAGSFKKYTAACRGDIGSPLIVDGLIVGLFSRTSNCSDPNQPAIYTNLAKYFTWIEYSIKLFT